ELNDADRAMAAEYLHLTDEDREETVWAFIRLTLSSVADTAVIPMQDYLALGAQARMNHPSTIGTNWRWRMTQGCLTDELIQKIGRLAELYGRHC
ncbi:MAG: 4-alpha-glucanotransferase, partial [Lachnospiraceae bacterium]